MKDRGPPRRDFVKNMWRNCSLFFWFYLLLLTGNSVQHLYARRIDKHVIRRSFTQPLHPISHLQTSSRLSKRLWHKTSWHDHDHVLDQAMTTGNLAAQDSSNNFSQQDPVHELWGGNRKGDTRNTEVLPTAHVENSNNKDSPAMTTTHVERSIVQIGSTISGATFSTNEVISASPSREEEIASPQKDTANAVAMSSKKKNVSPFKQEGIAASLTSLDVPNLNPVLWLKVALVFVACVVFLLLVWKFCALYGHYMAVGLNFVGSGWWGLRRGLYRGCFHGSTMVWYPVKESCRHAYKTVHLYFNPSQRAV